MTQLSEVLLTNNRIRHISPRVEQLGKLVVFAVGKMEDI